MSHCLLAQLVLMLEASFSLKHCRHLMQHSYLRMLCPLCSIKKYFYSLYKLSLIHLLNTKLCTTITTLSIQLSCSCTPPPVPLFRSLLFSYGCVSSFSLRGQRHPCVYLHSGCPLANEHCVSLFPTVHFVRLTMSL